jgi:polysaccharide export outer membrane protein
MVVPKGLFIGFLLVFVNVLGAQSEPTIPQSRESDNYLKSGDIVRVRAVGDAEILGEFTIDENGFVTLPKMGSRDAVHTPAEQFKKQLLADYAVFLRYPPEIVFLRRIMVWGAVLKPGLYPVDPTMTLSNVLVLAGGPAPDGKPDKIKLIRNNRVVTANLGPETSVAQAQLQSGDQIFVPQRAWLARNTGIAFGLFSVAVTLYSLVR